MQWCTHQCVLGVIHACSVISALSLLVIFSDPKRFPISALAINRDLKQGCLRLL